MYQLVPSFSRLVRATSLSFAVTRVCNWTWSWTYAIKLTFLQHVCPRAMLILSSWLRVCFRNGLLVPGQRTKILYGNSVFAVYFCRTGKLRKHCTDNRLQRKCVLPFDCQRRNSFTWHFGRCLSFWPRNVAEKKKSRKLHSEELNNISSSSVIGGAITSGGGAQTEKMESFESLLECRNK
jgi:hypothetical protein